MSDTHTQSSVTPVQLPRPDEQEGQDVTHSDPQARIDGTVSPVGETGLPVEPESRLPVQPEGSDTESPEANPDGMLAFWSALKLIGQMHEDGFRLHRGALIRVDAPRWQGGLWWCIVWYWSAPYGEMRQTSSFGYDRAAALFAGLRNWRQGRPASRFITSSAPVVEEEDTEDRPSFYRSYTRRLHPARSNYVGGAL